MLIVFATQLAESPGGNPVAVPIPVAPVVVCVIGEIEEKIQTDCVPDATLALFTAFTVIVPLAFTAPQPPANGIV